MRTFFLRLLIASITSFSALGFWSGIVLLNKSPFESEIKLVLKAIYLNQAYFVGNVNELTRLLVKDASQRINEKQND